MASPKIVSKVRALRINRSSAKLRGRPHKKRGYANLGQFFKPKQQNKTSQEKESNCSFELGYN